MSKISVLFKPASKSKINNDLTSLWYYEYFYKNLYYVEKEVLKNSRKIKIEWVPYDDIGDVYDYLQKYTWPETVAIIMCSITQLLDFK